MFLIICDIKNLEFKQLFSVVLSVIFRFKNSEEFKPKIINKVKKLLLYMFREVTIRGGFPRNASNDIIFPLLNEARKGEKEFLEDSEILKEEFNDQKTKEIYKKLLEEYEAGKNSIYRFILRSYYWEKLRREKELGKVLGIGIKEDLLKYEAEHIIAKNPRQKSIDYQKFDPVINSLGNYTLLTSNDNKKFADKLWPEKRV